MAQVLCDQRFHRIDAVVPNDWIAMDAGDGWRVSFQRSPDHVPPRWPDPAYPQQLHLDIRVSDADRAEQELTTLGATRIPRENETGFRVFTDPAGHPFCIVFGHPGTG